MNTTKLVSTYIQVQENKLIEKEEEVYERYLTAHSKTSTLLFLSH